MNLHDPTHVRFQEVARRRPELVALAGDGPPVTYGELNARADRVAAELRDRGAVPGEPVAVLLPRSPKHVAAILGAWKFGSACVPIDASLPEDRIARLLDASAAGAVIDGTGARRRHGGRAPFPAPAAYVFFTSGSTGAPKAVAVPHLGIVNEADWTREEYTLREHDRGTWLSSPQFAISRWELWPHLTTGASVLIARPDLVPDADTVRSWLLDEGATTTILVTGLGERVLGLTWPSDTALRLMIVGGEQLRRWPGDVPFRVVNSWGATETSGVRLTKTLHAGGEGFPPIGTPIANTSVHVLDEHGRPADEGELHIGGTGLALGYLDNPELTAARFIADPFAGGTARMYRTGDLVRRTKEGDIAYVGRAGADPKVGGARVDLAAVEAALLAHPDVAFAAVVVADGSLVAHVSTGAAPHELRSALIDRLPRNAIPTRFYRLTSVPTLVSGKLDRSALPAPQDADELLDPRLEPRDETERRVHRAFREVLAGAELGVLDDFFAVGGDSVGLTRVRALLAGEFGRDISPADLYTSRTVADVARLIVSAPELTARLSADSPVLPLSGVQRGLWLHEQNDTVSTAYLETVTITFDGPLDIEALRRAIADVVAGQELLRASLRPRDLMLVVEPTTCVVLPIGDAPAEPVAVDLTASPLFRLHLRRITPQHHELTLIVHHLVWDGGSAEVFLSELALAYDRVDRPRPGGYRPRQDADAGAALDHWRAELANVSAISPAFAAAAGERALGVITRPLPNVAGLAAAAAEARCSMLTLGAAAFGAALRACGGGDDPVFLTPVSLRDHDAARTIGPYLTMLPWHVQLGGDPTGRKVLTEAATALESAMAHTGVPFDAVVRGLHPRRAAGETPYGQFLFEVNRLPSPRTTSDGVGWRLAWSPSTAPKFRISVSWNDTGGDWSQRLEHDTTHVSAEQAERFLDELERHAGFLATDLETVLTGPVRQLPATAAAPAPSPAEPPAPPDVRQFLAGLWREELEIEAVGDEDNFVELGGHSLLAVRITLAVAERYGVRPPVQLIFDCDTFAEFASHVAQALNEGQAIDA